MVQLSARNEVSRVLAVTGEGLADVVSVARAD